MNTNIDSEIARHDRLTRRNHPTRREREAQRLKKHAARMRSTGDDDAVPVNMDDFRNELARRITRLIANHKGYWRGCPMHVCRRQRSCAAPKPRCSNAPLLAPDPTGRRGARATAMFQRAVRNDLARREAEEGKQ